MYIERVYVICNIMNELEYDMRVAGATILEEKHSRITMVKLWNSHYTGIRPNEIKERYFDTTLICHLFLQAVVLIGKK